MRARFRLSARVRERESVTESPIERANAFAACGKVFEAIALLTAENRLHQDFAVEARLLQLRHDAFALLDRTPPRSPWPPAVDDVFGRVDGLAEITSDELTLDTLRSGILAHGSLLVRGLIPPRHVDKLVYDIEQAHDSYDAANAESEIAAPPSWYVPFVPNPEYTPIARAWYRKRGVVIAADVPRAYSDLMECLDEIGLPALIQAYLGERPALSARKTTLRRIRIAELPERGTEGTDWHQDGAFMGNEIRSVNLWIALSPCGRDAPGMAIVGRRFEEILETGTQGANFENFVGHKIVERIGRDTPVVRPVFEAGDAMLFDHMTLHGATIEPEMTKDRFAIETWFFAPSCYPKDEIPLAY